jgi:hypothetical protein
MSDRGRGGGFILFSVVGVAVAPSRSWFTFWGWGREFTGVDGGRIGAGWRLGVGAIETGLQVSKSDGTRSCDYKLAARRLSLEESVAVRGRGLSRGRQPAAGITLACIGTSSRVTPLKINLPF